MYRFLEAVQDLDASTRSSIAERKAIWLKYENLQRYQTVFTIVRSVGYVALGALAILSANIVFASITVEWGIRSYANGHLSKENSEHYARVEGLLDRHANYIATLPRAVAR